MKAIFYDTYGPPEVLQLKKLEKPIPKPKQILIKIKAAAITMGDCEMRSPKIPNFTWFIVRLFFGIRKPKKRILGSYWAGEVAQTGQDVDTFKEGDKLFGISEGFGAHAEYLCLLASGALTSMPNEATYEEVAPMGLGLDSLHFLKKARIKAGDNILINGAGGGIGTYAVQLAKCFGAMVTAVDSADKLEMLTAVGADKVIDYKAGDFSKLGTSYDLVFDVVGALSYRQSMRLLNKKGRYITAVPLISGLLKGLWARLTSKKRIMTGLTRANKEELDFLKKMMEEGKLKTVIDKRFSIDEVPDAHNYIEQGHKRGNVVMVVD
ncbi:NAD(P)-dependent alcohol dehydrogenase [Spongiimicrobium sp. 3-5]|uniref:NAD(P)-dependent alcohol dehydrogenase n=1 Tax=Spongiimicrobium sp. 3-5 TaxID=3332596 RepID=UPI00397F19C4